MDSLRILMIGGPNLNLLAHRDATHYGGRSFERLQVYTEELLSKVGLPVSIELEWFQSNHEGELIETIHKALRETGGQRAFDGLVINPGGYGHTSVALHDAMELFDRPIIEVHFSHTLKREEFRHNHLTAKAANGLLIGCGPDAYYLGILRVALSYLQSSNTI